MKDEILEEYTYDDDKILKLIKEFEQKNGRKPTIHEKMLIIRECARSE